MDSDQANRLAVFKWLQFQTELYGNILPFSLLAKGFYIDGQHITLVSRRGIWKPRIFRYPISIRTSYKNPYRDDSSGRFIVYKYFQDNPNFADNVGLRNAMRDQVPLVYFHAISEGKYEVIWPVFISHDNQRTHEFGVTVDDSRYIEKRGESEETVNIRREYLTTVTQVRLFQSLFREQVLHAYREHCAFCSLHHAELLDAAHIVPDREEEGAPRVPNGLALCKIHHAAFDRNILGVRPDFKIEVRSDILRETDGPMLQHGLQGLHQKEIILPFRKIDHPDRALLEMRWEQFKNAV